MATRGWRTNTSVVDRLKATPRQFELIQAVRLLEIVAGAPWRDDRPRTVVRFRGPLDASFAANEVRRLVDGDPSILEVTLLGLTGPQGPLPAMLGRRILDMVRDGDTHGRDFLDIFNDRLIALLVDQIRSTNPALQPGIAELTTHARAMFSLIGLGTPGLRHTLRPPPQPRLQGLSRSLLKYVGLINQRPRSLQAVERLVSGYFGYPVKGRSFVGRWTNLPRASQLRLSASGTRLGTAALGRRVWLQDGAIGLDIGPLDAKKFIELLPSTSGNAELHTLLRMSVGSELDVECKLIVRKDDAPRARMGGDGAARLGLSSWLGEKPLAEDGVVRFMMRMDRDPQIAQRVAEDPVDE